MGGGRLSAVRTGGMRSPKIGIEKNILGSLTVEVPSRCKAFVNLFVEKLNSIFQMETLVVLSSDSALRRR